MANTENMAKWAEALESGEFEQGTGHLAIVELSSTGEPLKTLHCCLGVACEVAMRNGVELVKIQGSSDGRAVLFYDGESGVLPHKVQEWLGLDETNESEGGNPYLSEGSATELNDDAGFTFREIGEQVRLTFLTPA